MTMKLVYNMHMTIEEIAERYEKEMKKMRENTLDSLKDNIDISNAIYDKTNGRYVFYVFDDDLFKSLNEINDVECKMSNHCLFYFSKSFYEKTGIGDFQLVHWSFDR